MIPAAFEYEVAQSLDQAIELARRYGEDAKFLAGGQSLLPLMKLRLARPSALVDLGRIVDLSYIKEAGDSVAVGALTRHHDLQYSDVLAKSCPILAHAASLVGDPQVRHRGTIGGSVAHGDPASDLPAVLLALDAEFVVRGGEGERTIGAAEFFRGLFETALGPGEVLTEVRVPRLGPDRGWSYLKFNRRAQDWAIVGAAVIVDRSDGSDRSNWGGIASASIALTNMGMTPLRATGAEAALRGASEDAIDSAASLAAEGTSPPSDHNASAEFREHLARVLVARALKEALKR